MSSNSERNGQSGPDGVTVFLARHGRTVLNADGRLRGHFDVDLDDVGRLEADRLVTALAGADVGRVVSSPLRRAIQTANPVALAHGLDVETDDDLIDRDYGTWTGHPAADVMTAFGSLDATPGVEATSVLEQRLLRGFDRWMRPAGGATLFVGHDATNSTLLQLLLPELNGQEIEQHTGCWNRLEHRDGRWYAMAINQVPTGP